MKQLKSNQMADILNQKRMVSHLRLSLPDTIFQITPSPYSAEEIRASIKSTIDKNVPTILLSQIEAGITAAQYLQEGLQIMQEVRWMIDSIKKGNYNNFVGLEYSSEGTFQPPKLKLNLSRDDLNPDASSLLNVNEVAGTLNNSVDTQSMISVNNNNARCLMQIKRLEKELARLQKRYD